MNSIIFPASIYRYIVHRSQHLGVFVAYWNELKGVNHLVSHSGSLYLWEEAEPQAHTHRLQQVSLVRNMVSSPMSEVRPSTQTSQFADFVQNW